MYLPSLVVTTLILMLGIMRLGTCYGDTLVGPAPNPQNVSESSIAALNSLSENMISRWEALDAECSPLSIFALLYLYMTKGGLNYIQELYFEDGDAMANLMIVFAQRYIDAFDTWANGQLPSEPWQHYFNFTLTNRSSAIQDMLLGVNAHINYDLGIAVYESNYGTSSSRKDDYDRVNDLMYDIVVAANCDLGTRYDSTLTPTLLSPITGPLTVGLLTTWRTNAWNNAVKLYNNEITYQSMANAANVIALGFKTPALLPTAPARQAYCQANHDTEPTTCTRWTFTD